jgi:hypothetical protein
MPQPGLHGILALATRKAFSKARGFATGLAFGSMLPDMDAYPQAFAFLVLGMDSGAAYRACHRTFTHTLFVPLALAIVVYALSTKASLRRLRAPGLGIAVGMALLHDVPDIVGWFHRVDILWPVWSLDLWGGARLPERAISLFRASNFLSLALYFACLFWLAKRTRTSEAYRPRLRRHALAQLTIGLFLCLVAFLAPAGTYNVVDGALYLSVGLPAAFGVTWRMRDTIEGGLGTTAIESGGPS